MLNKNGIFVGLLFVIIIAGCAAENTKFTQVIIDHNTVTAQTVDSLRSSIEMELKNLNLSSDDIKKLTDLEDRLAYMKDSAAIIEKYHLQKNVTKEMLEELDKNMLSNRSKQ